MFCSFGLQPAQPLAVQSPLHPNNSVNTSLQMNTLGPVQRMDPLTNLQVCCLSIIQYNLDSPPLRGWTDFDVIKWFDDYHGRLLKKSITEKEWGLQSTGTLTILHPYTVKLHFTVKKRRYLTL